MDPITNKEASPGETPLRQIRTFQGDVAEALHKQEGSLVSIQQAEHERGRTQPGANTSQESSNTKAETFFLFLGSLVLFGLGTLGAWYGYHEFVRRTAIPIPAAPANRFVAIDSEITVNVRTSSRESLTNAIFEATRGTAMGQLRHIVLIKESVEKQVSYLPVNEFLQTLETRAPANLVRAFDPLFMLGAYGESVFIIIKLSSFENAFAGMLAWEKDLPRDIGPLLATAPFLRNLTPENIFTDITDRNKDARLLALGNETIMLYSFFDNDMLVITDEIGTLRTVIERLTREKLSR
ncbi:MAG: hypothetical protein WD896_01910 [Parcubacteria group bacterium]